MADRKCCVMTVGLQRMASHLASTPSKTLFTHIALGTGDIVCEAGDLSLVNEFYRVPFDSVYQDDVACVGNIIITGTDIGNDDYTIRELGLYDAAVGGNLICRQVLHIAHSISGLGQMEITWPVILTT